MLDTKKISFIITLIIMALFTAPVLAATNSNPQTFNQPNHNLPTNPKESEKVWVIEGQVTFEQMDEREIILTEFLEKRGSPLASYAKEFVEVADKYDLDYRFLPAISCLESSCGLIQHPGSHNPFGWGPHIRFDSWPEAFETVASGIRTRYVREGKVTPGAVGPTYAASPTWSSRVTSFMLQIENSPI